MEEIKKKSKPKTATEKKAQANVPMTEKPKRVKKFAVGEIPPGLIPPLPPRQIVKAEPKPAIKSKRYLYVEFGDFEPTNPHRPRLIINTETKTARYVSPEIDALAADGMIDTKHIPHTDMSTYCIENKLTLITKPQKEFKL